MLIYEEGAKFDEHKDTEKERGMFGTLIVCLPSKHVGGTLKLVHGQETIEINTAETSAYHLTYGAWYSDFSHRIMSVVFGYRWVLTYNLIHVSSPITPSASLLDVQVQGLGKLLKEMCEFSDVTAICWYLDHTYSHIGLNSAILKGKDQYRVMCIKEACNAIGRLVVRLAHLEREDDMGGEGNIRRDDKGERLPARTSYHATPCVNQDGEPTPRISFREDMMIQNDTYDNRREDEHSGGQYYGNSHENTFHTYRDTVRSNCNSQWKSPVPNMTLGFVHSSRDRLEERRPGISSENLCSEADTRSFLNELPVGCDVDVASWKLRVLESLRAKG